MSAVVKAAKVTRYIFAAAVVLFVLFAISAYMQADSISKAYIERVASQTLGVSVTIGDMDLSVEKKLVKLNNIKIGNPAGYKEPYVATVDSVEVNVDTFDRERMTFNLAMVKGLTIFLEMNPGSTNIHDLRRQAEQNAKNSKPDGEYDEVRAMIRTITYDDPVIKPITTLQPTNIGGMTANDIFVRDIGTNENGLKIPQVVAKVVSETVAPINLIANQAELFKGMNLETLNSMGISTYDVFKKNVNKKINKDLDEAGKLFNNLYDDVSKNLGGGTSEEDTPSEEGEGQDAP